jgi:Mitochondrial carrier protein
MAVSSGCLAGLVCDTVMHPVDTVRARLQVHRGTGLGLTGTFSHMLRTERLSAFYRGFPVGLLC